MIEPPQQRPMDCLYYEPIPCALSEMSQPPFLFIFNTFKESTVPVSLKPIRRGPFLDIRHCDSRSTWVVHVSYKTVEYPIGTYTTQAAAQTAFENHMLSRALQLFDPLTTEQIRELASAAGQYLVLKPFLERITAAWQPIQYPKKRANKAYASRKEDAQ